MESNTSLSLLFNASLFVDTGQKTTCDISSFNHDAENNDSYIYHLRNNHMSGDANIIVNLSCCFFCALAALLAASILIWSGGTWSDDCTQRWVCCICVSSCVTGFRVCRWWSSHYQHLWFSINACMYVYYCTFLCSTIVRTAQGGFTHHSLFMQ